MSNKEPTSNNLNNKTNVLKKKVRCNNAIWRFAFLASGSEFMHNEYRYLLNMVFSKAYNLFSFIFYFIFTQMYYLGTGTFWCHLRLNWIFGWNVWLLKLLRQVYDESLTSATRLISPKHTTFHISTDNEDKTLIFFSVIMFSWQIWTQRFYLLPEFEA